MSKQSNIQERIDRGLQDLYAFFDDMVFPVVLYVYNDRQNEAVVRLLENTLSIPYATEDICCWCITHGIEYEVFASKLDMLLPWRRLAYKRITQQFGGGK